MTHYASLVLPSGPSTRTPFSCTATIIAALSICTLFIPINAQSDLLVIMGAVTETSARALVEWTAQAEPVPCSLWIVEGFQSILQAPESSLPLSTFIPARYPRAVTIPTLQPDRDYTLVLSHAGSIDTATFSTPSSSPNARPWRTVALSCDRFLDDGDDEFVLEMGRQLYRSYSLMLHLGDQASWKTYIVRKLGSGVGCR